jgi:hypothetical protein
MWSDYLANNNYVFSSYRVLVPLRRLDEPVPVMLLNEKIVLKWPLN